MAITLEALVLALARDHGLQVTDQVEGRFVCETCGSHISPVLDDGGRFPQNWWKACRCHTKKRTVKKSTCIAHDPVTKKYKVRKTVRGKEYKRTFSLLRTATEYVAQLEKLAAGTLDIATLGPAKLTGFTAQKICDKYIAKLRFLQRKDTTVGYYEQKFAALNAILGEVRIDTITEDIIEDYVETRREAKVSNGTIMKELRAFATACRKCGHPPSWLVPELSHVERRRKTYRPEQILALWNLLDRDARAAVGLCLFTGMRASEAYKLKITDIDGDELRIPEVSTKTGEPVRTYIVPTLRAVLPENGPADAKLITLSEFQLRHRLEAVSKTVGITPVISGIGHFRHHAATYAAETGHSHSEIQLITAHKSGTVTDRYVHSQSVGLKKEILTDIESFVLGTWKRAS